MVKRPVMPVLEFLMSKLLWRIICISKVYCVGLPNTHVEVSK
jgi:hypothetical protein